jgi:hypothetical protein
MNQITSRRCLRSDFPEQNLARLIDLHSIRWSIKLTSKKGLQETRFVSACFLNYEAVLIKKRKRERKILSSCCS